MHTRNKWTLAFGLVAVAGILLAACATPTAEVIIQTVPPETIIQTAAPIRETVVVQPTAPPVAPAEPRTLVICQGQEPDTLYLYGGSMLAASHVQQAIYDGPIDGNSFAYQPIILEKLPSLADGDAAINTVDANAGDTIMTGEGADTPGALEAGVFYRPAGCRANDCAVEYDGTSTVEMNQMEVTFKLIEGISWSDGEPLTANDSVYSYELQIDPDTPAPSKFTAERTASYEATDDLTAVWTGLPGFTDATYFINFWTPLPRHAWEGFTALELIEAEESSRTPMGWGAYVIDEWLAGDRLNLHKNENYFRADEGLPYFQNVVYRTVGENSNANLAALLAGDCDIVDQTSHLDDQSELLLELQAAGSINATFVTGTVFEHADFNLLPVESYDGFASTGAFSDLRLRTAVANCMDRQAVVDTVMFGQSIVLDVYLPPVHPLFNANAKHYDFDVAAGTALLDEIGWLDDDADPATPRVATGVEGVADGTLLEFNYGTTSATQRVQATQVMQASLAECGIKVNLQHLPAGEWFADGPDGPLFGRQYDLGQFAWLTGVQPACDLWLTEQIPADENAWSGQNNTGWSNAEYDTACKGALQSLPGEPAYETFHLEAQRIWAENLPEVPLYLRLKLAATRPDMCGFIMDPTENSEMFNIESFNYGEGCA